MKKNLVLLSLLGLLNAAPCAFGQYFYLVQKEQDFDQIANSTVVADANPYDFSVQIGKNGNSTEDSNTPTPPNQFTAPGNATVYSLNPPGGSDSEWKYKQLYATQRDMDAAFPNGTYSLTMGGSSGNIGLNGDLYTNTPIANLSVPGSWSGTVYTIYQGQSLVISTNSIAGFTTGNFRVGIDASPVSGFMGGQDDIQFDSFDSGLMDSSGNITIPGNLLQAGETWNIQLEFNAFSALNGTLLPNGTTVALYTATTNFQVSAIPEPADAVLLASAAALGFACWRRRKVKVAVA